MRLAGRRPTACAHCTGRDGALWVATAATASCAAARGAGRTRCARTTVVSAIHEDLDGTIWLGTEGGRLYRPRPGIPGEAKGTSAGGVRALRRDRGGNLWIASVGADWCASRATSSRLSTAACRATTCAPCTKISKAACGPAPMAADCCGSATASSRRSASPKACPAISPGRSGRDGGIWVGTDAGLSRYVDGRFEHLAPALGLENVRIRTVLEEVAARSGSARRVAARSACTRQAHRVQPAHRPVGRSGQGDHRGFPRPDLDRHRQERRHRRRAHRGGRRRFVLSARSRSASCTRIAAAISGSRPMRTVCTCSEDGRIVRYTQADGLPGNRVTSI